MHDFDFQSGQLRRRPRGVVMACMAWHAISPCGASVGGRLAMIKRPRRPRKGELRLVGQRCRFDCTTDGGSDVLGIGLLLARRAAKSAGKRARKTKTGP